MFGNETLYTTMKCRSMTTKNEFVEMWNNCHEIVKKIRLTSGDCVFADSYVIGENLIDFDLDDVTFGVFSFENIKGIECE